MSTFEITFNSRPLTVPAGTTLRELIGAQLGKELDARSLAVDGSKLGVAAAVDSAVIPRSAWHGFQLAGGHSIELVTAAQGG